MGSRTTTSVMVLPVTRGRSFADDVFEVGELRHGL